MVVIGFYDFAKSDGWRLKLSQHLSRFKIVDLMSKEGQLADIALVWAHPMGCFSSMPNLKGIINRGQGVDHILSDKSIPRDIPLVRLVDHDMSEALSHWVILSALNFWRDADYYRSCQNCQIWKPLEQRPVDKALVGIMGIGAIGRVVAERFSILGFNVRGWARSPKKIENVEVFFGDSQLDEFLDGVNILVSVLPLTGDTTAIMDSSLFSKVARGAFVINAGRGQQLVEDDLISAISQGNISGAALDVFQKEPLPAGHPFWTHPKITIWPHVAAQTNPDTAAAQVAEAIKDIMSGKKPKNTVDRDIGY